MRASASGQEAGVVPKKEVSRQNFEYFVRSILRGWGRLATMLVAKCQGFRHPFLKLFDAGPVAGMGGHEFGWLFAFADFSHALPESWGFRGIETGPSDK
jgi:hypothetical protein